MQRQEPKKYAPETVQLEKNYLADLKRKVDNEMAAAMVDSLVDEDPDNEKLQNLILCEPDVEGIQKIVSDKAKSLKQVAQENKDLKTQLQTRVEIYGDAVARLDAIEEENNQLQKEQSEKCLTKKQLTDLLTQKTKKTDKECKELEKQFLGKTADAGSIDPKTFAKEYLAMRVNYHKCQIYKAKVGSS